MDETHSGLCPVAFDISDIEPSGSPTRELVGWVGWLVSWLVH
jgi:hypothetical protein